MTANQMTMFNNVNELLSAAGRHRVSIHLQQVNRLCNAPRILLGKPNIQQTTCISVSTKLPQ